jgi:O-antigen biosynthesis protein
VSVAARPRIAWLSEKLLLVARSGDYTDNGLAGPAKLVGGAERTLTLDAGHFQAPPNNGTPAVTVSICRLPTAISLRSAADLAIEQGDERFGLGVDGPLPAGSELQSILRTELAGLDAPTREGLLHFIATAAGEDLYGPGGLMLAKKLALIRDALRERLPYCVVAEEEPLGLRVDEIHALDDRIFWLKGWLWDVDTPLESLTFMSPEGCSVEVLDSAFRYRRLDIEQIYANTHGQRPDSGFLACVRLDAPSRLSDGWIAQLRNVLGAGVEVKGPSVGRGLAGCREAILRDLDNLGQASDRLVADHVQPAITCLQRRIADTTTVERDEWYGTPPVDPDVSIVVPLGNRGDALEKQLIQFRRDPEIAQAEIIYLVGSAHISQDLISKAAELEWLYGVSFRLVSLSQKDRATAKMNVGASLASSPNLLFMSPDVFADSPGWLGTLLAFRADRTDVGAVGPKLMYEDGSVQHAGLHFDRVSREELRSLEPPERSLWELRYRFKGMPEEFEGVSEACPVPAVSNAALLIEREAFEEVGGFENKFIDSDYEAADLCLRLGEAGRTNWYLPDAKLHCLEGRSRSEVSVRPSHYDVILHSQLWGERMESLATS